VPPQGWQQGDSDDEDVKGEARKRILESSVEAEAEDANTRQLADVATDAAVAAVGAIVESLEHM
jgi:hypothetical protein